jgi:predicted HNH restriction endonuclease
MIPRTIGKEHVLLAITDIKTGGVPARREATKYNLIFEKRIYPPKLCLSLAGKYATGVELSPEQFSGGDEANNYLRELGFDVQAKNPDWSWKECYFAVWGYDQLDQDPTQVKAVLYREISDLIGRSAKSVEYKLQNVSSFDTRPRSEKPIAEASNAQALLGEVFKWYWSDKSHARNQYLKFREEFEFSLESTIAVGAEQSTLAMTSADVIIEEGAVVTSPMKRRKRSQKLIEEGRKHFRNLEPDGRLHCWACGFATPEEIEVEIVQLHHKNQISESDHDGRSIPLDEAIASIVPLCPTCHSIAHTEKPPMSVDAIKQRISTRSHS